MRKPRYGIIALDLDGTLLNSDKQLTSANFEALKMAADAGVEIVPTTGRYFNGMPEVIRNLPFLHYAITINGASVVDLRTGETIYRAEIPNQRAREIMAYLDQLPVIYDCFMENSGWATRALQAKAGEFAMDQHVYKMLVELRTPVEELKAYLQECGKDVQKIQFFAKTPELRDQYVPELQKAFPEMVMTSSIINNLEINADGANKGDALKALADRLAIPVEETMSFGDGTNDLSMLRMAGCGIAMKNAKSIVQEAADFVTASCDEDGVAKGIMAHLF